MKSTKEKITSAYQSARMLIKSNNPQAARACVLEMLNAALEEYKASTSALTKARNAAFLERWIAVSRELYSVGITDFVLECFGLYEPTPADSAAHPIKTGKNTASASASGDWVAVLFEKYEKAIVQIRVSSQQKGGNGTGFIISKNGYLLTNDHVVFDADAGTYYPSVKMSFIGSKRKYYKLQVLYSDSKNDVALCRFDPNEVGEFSVVKRVADFSAVKPGVACVLMGNALGQGIAPSEGIVRFPCDDHDDMTFTAHSNPGDSGAPILNRAGECIGINRAKTVSLGGEFVEAYAHAVPMNVVDALLAKWTKNGGILL